MLVPDDSTDAPGTVSAAVCETGPDADTMRFPPLPRVMLTLSDTLPAAVNASEAADPDETMGASTVMSPGCMPLLPVVIITDTPEPSSALISVVETLASLTVGMKMPALVKDGLVHYQEQPRQTGR